MCGITRTRVKRESDFYRTANRAAKRRSKVALGGANCQKAAKRRAKEPDLEIVPLFPHRG